MNFQGTLIIGEGTDDFSDFQDSERTLTLDPKTNFEQGGFDHKAHCTLLLSLYTILQVEVTVCGDTSCFGEVCVRRLF